MLVHRLMLALETEDYYLLDNLARYLKCTRTETLRRALREMSDRTGPVKGLGPAKEGASRIDVDTKRRRKAKGERS